MKDLGQESRLYALHLERCEGPEAEAKEWRFKCQVVVKHLKGYPIPVHNFTSKASVRTVPVLEADSFNILLLAAGFL